MMFLLGYIGAPPTILVISAKAGATNAGAAMAAIATLAASAVAKSGILAFMGRLSVCSKTDRCGARVRSGRVGYGAPRAEFQAAAKESRLGICGRGSENRCFEWCAGIRGRPGAAADPANLVTVKSAKRSFLQAGGVTTTFQSCQRLTVGAA